MEAIWNYFDDALCPDMTREIKGMVRVLEETDRNKEKYNEVLKQLNFFIKDDWIESGWADYEHEDPLSMYEYFCGELDGWNIYVHEHW